jgi:hypothetical protein
MSEQMTPADLEEPELTVAGFQLWVHGRQFPESQEFYDGNWLQVTAHCGAPGASVWTQGAILLVTDIAGFGNQCAAMLKGETKSVTLAPLEPDLKISLEAADRLGHIRAKVDITPDNLAQAHWFEFQIDQSYLSGIIRQCSAILQKYPIRGSQYR